MPKIILFTLFISLFSLGGYSQKKNEVVTFSEANGPHKVRLLFRTKAFDAKKHKIKTATGVKSTLQQTWIDGKLALGTDISVPKIEIASVKLYFGEKEVLVPRSMFSDCYNPNLGKDYFRLKIGDDRKSVLAFMAGGDGGAGYQVFWILRSDGRHSRFSNTVSDADYSSFMNWFFEQ